MRGHQDAGFGPVHARLPGPGSVQDFPVFNLFRVLAQVPHVAVSVLREPVEGVFDQVAVEVDAVADDGGRDACYLAGLVQHLDDDALHPVFGLAFVGPHGAWRQGEVRIRNGRLGV